MNSFLVQASKKRTRTPSGERVLAVASLVMGCFLAYFLQNFQASLFAPVLTKPAPLQVRVFVQEAKAPVSAASSKAVLPIQGKEVKPLRTTSTTPSSPDKTLAKPQPVPANPQEPEHPGSNDGKFTADSSLEAVPKGLVQANPETTPNSDAVVLELKINDKGIVVSSRVKVASGNPLQDTTMALVAMGQFYGKPVPPLLPGETRTVDMPIYYNKPATAASAASSASNLLP